MRVGISSRWLLLWFAFAAMSTVAAPAKPEVYRVGGTTYVSLSSWAAANNLSISWVKRDKILQVTNRTAQLRLEPNSRNCTANNIQVWLLFPVIGRGDKVYLSQLDADTTLRPLLFPARNPSGAKVRTICIDPGHGGKDPGETTGKRKEKEYTLLLANELRNQLRTAGFNVILTRSTDTFLELSSRPTAAQRVRADLFVSLHFNSTVVGRGTVQGVETYALTPAGARSTASAGKGDIGSWVTGNKFDGNNLLLAWQVQRALTQRLAAEDRGVRRARFQVLREAAMPALLIEGGFLSHPSEGKRIADAAYRRNMARAITTGIQAYKQTVERPH